jgi:hypothetical protein
MCWWFCYLGYALTMIACKLSIGYFLLRVTTEKIQRWTIYLAMFSTVISCGIFFFVTLFQCHPISYFWNKDQDGKCINPGVVIGLAALYSVFAVGSDLVFALLPGWIVWNLQLHKRTKYSLIPLLAMGCMYVLVIIQMKPIVLTTHIVLAQPSLLDSHTCICLESPIFSVSSRYP